MAGGVQVRLSQIDHHEVRPLPHGERPDLILEPERPRPAQGRELEHGSGRQHVRAEPGLLDQRREPHLREDVEPVVARGAVGAERDPAAGTKHLRHPRHPAAELQIG